MWPGTEVFQQPHEWAMLKVNPLALVKSSEDSSPVNVFTST